MKESAQEYMKKTLVILGTHTRASRREFAGVFFFLLFIDIPMLIADLLIEWDRQGPFVGLLSSLFLLFAFLPSAVITIRRLHDIGLSGRYYLGWAVIAGCTSLMPSSWALTLPVQGFLLILNLAFQLVLMAMPGQQGTNQWDEPLHQRTTDVL